MSDMPVSVNETDIGCPLTFLQEDGQNTIMVAVTFCSKTENAIYMYDVKKICVFSSVPSVIKKQRGE